MAKKQTKQKVGRPAYGPNGKMSEVFQIRLANTEKAKFQLAADLAGLKLAAWIRDRLDKAAEREFKQDKRREGESNPIR